MQSGKEEQLSDGQINSIVSNHIRINNIKGIKDTLLENIGYKITTTDSQGNTILHVAMEKNVSSKVLTFLLNLSGESVFFTIDENNNATNSERINHLNKSPLSIALESNQTEKALLYLQEIYKKFGKNKLPNLNGYVDICITKNNHQILSLLLQYGATLNLQSINSVNGDLLNIFLQFGYGVGIYFNNPDVYQNILSKLPSQTCMVGAYIEGELLGDIKYPSSAMTTLNNILEVDKILENISDLNNLDSDKIKIIREALSIRIQTQWEYFFQNLDKPIELYNLISSFNYTFEDLKKSLEGEEHFDRIYFLKDFLEEKTQVIDNKTLQDINQCYNPNFSLKRLAINSIVCSINENEKNIENFIIPEYHFILKLIINNPHLNISQDKKYIILREINNLQQSEINNTNIKLINSIKDLFVSDRTNPKKNCCQSRYS